MASESYVTLIAPHDMTMEEDGLVRKAGESFELPVEEFRGNYKSLKAGGYLPGRAGLQQMRKEQDMKFAGSTDAGEDAAWYETSPQTTAGLMGALRGATFGGSDVALQMSGVDKDGASDMLREANPNVSMATEIGGNILTGGIAGGARALSGSLGRKALTGAVQGGLNSGGMAMAGQARDDGNYDLAEVGLSAAEGAALGGGLAGAGGLARLPSATASAAKGTVGAASGLGTKILDKLDALTPAAGGGVVGAGLELGRQTLSSEEYDFDKVYDRGVDGALVSGLGGIGSGSGGRIGSKQARNAVDAMGRWAKGAAGKATKTATKQARDARGRFVKEQIKNLKDANPNLGDADIMKILPAYLKRIAGAARQAAATILPGQTSATGQLFDSFRDDKLPTHVGEIYGGDE